MSFDYFAKLFTKRGKSTIVEYPSKTILLGDAKQVEKSMRKDHLQRTLTSSGAKLPVNSIRKIEHKSVTQESNKLFATGNFTTSYMTTEKILGFFYQVYLPEQLLLDDELERIRIECISALTSLKANLKALYYECLAHSVN
jgi:hypothetical protein